MIRIMVVTIAHRSSSININHSSYPWFIYALGAFNVIVKNSVIECTYIMDKNQLISLIHGVPSIWDKRHRHHHNRYILSKKWREIAARLQVPEKEVKMCWKNLRQEFGKCLRKNATRSTDAASEESENTWPYFQKLQFLKEQFTPMASNLKNLKQSPPYTSNTESAWLSLTEPDQLINTSDSESAPNTQSNSDYFPSKTGYKRRITPQVKTAQPLVESEKKIVELGENLGSQLQQDNEDIGFFNSLLPHVKNLSPRDKLQFRIKVQQTLFELLFPPYQTNSQQVPPQNRINPSMKHAQKKANLYRYTYDR